MKALSYNQFKLLHLLVSFLAVIAYFMLACFPAFYPVPTTIIFRILLLISIALSVYCIFALQQTKWVYIDELVQRNEGIAAQSAIIVGFTLFFIVECIFKHFNLLTPLVVNHNTVIIMYTCISAIQDLFYLIFERRESFNAGISNED